MNFDNYNYNQLIKCFNTGVFKQYTQADKLNVLTALENKIVEMEIRPNGVEKREPASIVNLERQLFKKNNYGEYYGHVNTIKIDLKLPPLQVLHTYFHESRHAQQNLYKLEHFPIVNQNVDKKIIVLESTMDDKGNMFFYNKYTQEKGKYKSINAYGKLLNETDANVYATGKMIELSNEFKNDKNYKSFIKKQIQEHHNIQNNVSSEARSIHSDRITDALKIYNDVHGFEKDDRLALEKEILDNTQIKEQVLSLDLMEDNNHLISQLESTYQKIELHQEDIKNKNQQSL